MPARKRELIEPHAEDEYSVRRERAGRIDEVDDVGRSLGHDIRKEAQVISHRGQRDRGDWLGPKQREQSR